MSWFNRSREPITIEAFASPPPLEVRDALVREAEASVHLDGDTHVWQPADKPQDLVDAVARHSGTTTMTALAVDEWQRPSWPTLPWSSQLPRRPGLYWWRPIGQPSMPPQLAVVIEFGSRLCTCRRDGDHSTFTSVGSRDWAWCGPIPVPEGLDLEQLELSATTCRS